jgi:hypothetical protein
VDRRGRVALLPFDDPRAAAFLEPVPEQQRFASWHLAMVDGRVSSRGRAFADLLAALGFSGPAGLARRLDEPIEHAYALVASHRETLGRIVPDGPAPRRPPS